MRGNLKNLEKSIKMNKTKQNIENVVAKTSNNEVGSK